MRFSVKVETIDGISDNQSMVRSINDFFYETNQSGGAERTVIFVNKMMHCCVDWLGRKCFILIEGKCQHPCRFIDILFFIMCAG